MLAFSRTLAPRAGNGYADCPPALVEAAAGDGDALAARVQQIEALVRDIRSPSGTVVPAMARAFAPFQRRDSAPPSSPTGPVWALLARLVGSLGQIVLIEAK